jgi:hypothetical protein
MIDFGKAEILKREMAQGGHRPRHIQAAFPDFFEKPYETSGIHFAAFDAPIS